MREWIVDFLRSLPWRRIVCAAIGLGFFALELSTRYGMGRRSPWVLLAIIFLSVAASDEPLFRGNGFGSAGVISARGRRWLDDRKKRAEASKGAAQKAREQRLAKRRRWRS